MSRHAKQPSSHQERRRQSEAQVNRLGFSFAWSIDCLVMIEGRFSQDNWPRPRLILRPVVELMERSRADIHQVNERVRLRCVRQPSMSWPGFDAPLMRFDVEVRCPGRAFPGDFTLPGRKVWRVLARPGECLDEQLGRDMAERFDEQLGRDPDKRGVKVLYDAQSRGLRRHSNSVNLQFHRDPGPENK